MPNALTHYCKACNWQQTEPFFGESSLSHCPRCRSEQLNQRQATRLETVTARLANQPPPPPSDMWQQSQRHSPKRKATLVACG